MNYIFREFVENFQNEILNLLGLHKPHIKLLDSTKKFASLYMSSLYKKINQIDGDFFNTINSNFDANYPPIDFNIIDQDNTFQADSIISFLPKSNFYKFFL